MSTQPAFVSVPHMQAVKLYSTASASIPADTSTYVSVFTGNSSGSLVRAINVATDSSSAVTVRLAIALSGVSYPLCTVQIPANSGMTAGTPAVNLCDPAYFPSTDPIPNRGIFLTSGAVLQMSLPSALLATDKNMYVTVFGGDF